MVIFVVMFLVEQFPDRGRFVQRFRYGFDCPGALSFVPPTISATKLFLVEQCETATTRSLGIEGQTADENVPRGTF